MGRFATAAIIALALAGAAVESHADDITAAAQTRPPAVPVEQLLADSAPAMAAPASPGPEAPPPSLGVPPPAGPDGDMSRPPRPDGMDWAGRHHMRPDMVGAMWRMHQMERTWGLFFNAQDKNLSNSDVQVLAEAILLVHGNHGWKVTDVADAADGQVAFAYAAADGTVIARFEIDRHSGRVIRSG